MLDDLEAGRDIAKRVDRLLKKADAYGRYPTPVDDIVAAAKLAHAADYAFDDSRISMLPANLRKLARSGMGKIQGLIDRRERVIHIPAAIDNPGKRRFIAMHETTHGILPHQQDLLYADDNETLSSATNQLFEKEANHGAAELIFQREYFARDAADSEISIASVVHLSQRYGSSIQAALRRYAECHPGAVAALVLSPTPVSTDPSRWQRYEYMSTPEWRRRIGKTFWPRVMSVTDYSFLSAFALPNLDHVQMPDALGSPQKVHVEVMNTSYRSLVLLWLPESKRIIARKKVRFAT